LPPVTWYEPKPVGQEPLQLGGAELLNRPVKVVPSGGLKAEVQKLFIQIRHAGIGLGPSPPDLGQGSIAVVRPVFMPRRDCLYLTVPIVPIVPQP
jgi:hypothetical protein